MTAINISFSVRLLSWMYVNVWIPIRLTYLRMKIALRPVTNVACEIIALLNMIWSFVPISIMMIFAETVNGLAKVWLRLVCLGYEKALGVEPGSLYEQYILNNSLVAFDDDCLCDGENEPINDKNSEEQITSTLEEAKMVKEDN